jgi:hypothetical protein
VPGPFGSFVLAGALPSSGSTISPSRLVGRTFSTPGGRPAPTSNCVSASEDSGVCGAGLRMLVHPAAIAGPTLRAPMASGKFHGTISRHGPTGCFSWMLRAAPSGQCAWPPSMRTASSANQRIRSAA